MFGLTRTRLERKPTVYPGTRDTLGRYLMRGATVFPFQKVAGLLNFSQVLLRLI